MFLKKVSSQFNKISYRLAFSYLSFFIPCYLITFGIFYFWTADFLKSRDHDLIEARVAQYQEIIEHDGVGGIKRIYDDSKTRLSASRYLLRLTDLSGDVLFYHMSEEINYRGSELELESQLKKTKDLISGEWLYIDSNDNDLSSLEVKSVLLNNDLRLDVGASTNPRDELLEKFQAIFLTIFIPLLFSSILLSIYIAQKFLRPINNLSHLIKFIKNGNLSSRAALPQIEDELYDLTVAFNDMIAQIDYLVDAMGGTLDNVAHDLRTPLARARLATELALKSKSPEQMKIAAEESIENLDVILEMITTLMTMSAHNLKTINVKKEVFSGRNVIQEIVDLYFFVAEEKNIALIVECEEREVLFKADKLMIRQALANLLDNAIKYSHSDTSITLGSFFTDQKIVLFVKDEGIGISKEDIPRIWERLYRADKSRNEKGFGLGLSLVKIFVEANGGNVRVESEIGKGSTFFIEFPR